MVEPAVAPYGGLLVKTIADEQEREAKLQEQTIEVDVNGQTEVIRPESLYIKGVDNLSTDDIKCFVDYYLNTIVKQGDEKIEYESVSTPITYKVEWINDTSVNIVFQTHEQSMIALSKLISLDKDVDEIPKFENIREYINDIIQLRETKPYSATINFKNQQNLLKRLDIIKDVSQETSEMEEDDSDLIIHIRQSFQSDRKVKNAKEYSRYYLLHGEPERKRFYKNHRDTNKFDRRSSRRKSEEDLFADKLKQIGKSDLDDDEEDLFADRIRERSPSRRSKPAQYSNNRWRERR